MQDMKMPAMLKGNSDPIIAENVRMLKNRGFDDASAVKLAQQYAQNMSDITVSKPAIPGMKPKPMTSAAPSEQPVSDPEEKTEASDNDAEEKAEY